MRPQGPAVLPPSSTLPVRDNGSMAPTLTLTDEFQTALDHLHAGDHLFLTGRAGTGKSTLIRHFLETTERSAITVAPTGIAALNVDGYTIHRLFSFPLGVNEELVRGAGYYPGRFARALAALDTLIIDEASMVRADLFDALDRRARALRPEAGHSPSAGCSWCWWATCTSCRRWCTDSRGRHRRGALRHPVLLLRPLLRPADVPGGGARHRVPPAGR